ncbi:MAG: LEA type 2 family protein [Chitinophagales bacterium]|nr:LEA type 2 family protein [Chitinophagales bacterium]MDW8419414.1 LEA type 2 family protein [Chitinophagales bacterium]
MSKVFALSVVACLALTLSSCKLQEPTFKNLQSVKIERLGGAGFKAGGEAVFYNPNRFRVKITDLNIDVNMDNRTIGSIGEKDDVIIRPRSEFVVPFGFTFNPEGGLLDNLKSAMNIVTGKGATLSLNGNIRFKWLAFSKQVPIKYQQQFKLSDIWQGK